MDLFDLVATIRINLEEFDRGLNSASNKFKSFSDNLSKAGSGMKDLLTPAVEGFKAVEKVGKNTADVVKKGLTGFAAAATAVGGFGAAAVKSGMNFDSAMSEVSAISGATGQDFQDLRNKALEMGAKTKFSASEAAAAMTYMGMAGWKAGDMISGIEGVMDLAAASGEDLATTSDIVTDALTAFGLKASDSGHFADVLAAASTNANTNVGMLGETFKYAAPVAGALGFSIEDVSIAAGLMANSGIKASQAGTSLRSIFSAMTGPIDLVGSGIGEVTIATQNADGSMRGLNEIIDDLRVAFGGMTESEKATNAEAIAGKYAMSGFLALVNAAPEDVEKLTNALNDCNGAAKEMSKTMMDNLQGDLTLLSSAFESLQIAISDALTPTLREFAQFGQKAMAELLSGFQGGGVSGFMSALTGIVTDGVTMLAEKAPLFADVSMQFIEALATGILNAHGKIRDSAYQVLSTITDGLNGWLSSHSNELFDAGADIIRFIFNAFTQAGSIISEYIDDFVPLIASAFLLYHEALFTVGLDILGAIGRGIVENKDEIKTIATETIYSMATALRDNADDIIDGGIALLEALVGAIEENLPLILETGGQIIGKLIEGISTASPGVQAIIATAVLPHILKIIETVTNVGKTVSSVVDLVGGGLNTITDIGSKLMSGIQALWGLIAANPVVAAIAAIIAAIALLWANCEEFRDAVGKIWEAIVGFFQEAAKAIQGAFEGAVAFFKGIWEGIQDVFSKTSEWFGGVFSDAWGTVKKAWSGVTKFFSGVWEDIMGVFGDAWNEFTKIGGNIVKGIRDGISSAWKGLKEWVGEKFDGLVQSVKNKLKIKSPSRVFAGIGENMALGLAQGWDNEYSGIKRQIERGMDFGSASASLYVGANTATASGIKTAPYTSENPSTALQPINIVVQSVLDGRVIGETSYTYMMNKQRAYGGAY